MRNRPHIASKDYSLLLHLDCIIALYKPFSCNDRVKPIPSYRGQKLIRQALKEINSNSMQ